MKLDCQFVVGDKVQVRGHSEWGNLTVVAVDVIYTIASDDGIEDAYSEDYLKKVFECDHQKFTICLCGWYDCFNKRDFIYCPKCGEKL
jgi:hypothetical protein